MLKKTVVWKTHLPNDGIWDKALFSANPGIRLLTQTQLRNQSTIALDVDALEVLEHAAALTDHQQQTTMRVVILAWSFRCALR